MNLLKYKLTENSYWNDLGITIFISLTIFAIYYAYQWLPLMTISLLIGVPLTIVFARWLLIWETREHSGEPGPFEIASLDE
jgi:hypothetical protein